MLKFNPKLSTTKNLFNFGYTHKNWKWKHSAFKREIYNKNNVCIGVANCFECNDWLKKLANLN